jgi:WD40 repeat protein
MPAVASDGSAWATAGMKGPIVLEHAGAPEHQLDQGSPTASLAFSRDGQRLAAGSFDGSVKVWDVKTGALVKLLSGHAAMVRWTAFSPDGKLLATGSEDATIRVWPLDHDGPARVLVGHRGSVYCVQFDRDGKRLVSAGSDGVVRLWDAPTGAPLDALDVHAAEAWYAEFDRSGTVAVSAGLDDVARVWRIPQLARRLDTPAAHGIDAVAIDRAGNHMLTAGADGVARVFDREGKQLAALEPKLGTLWAAALSPDGTSAVLGSEDGHAIAWHVDATGAPQPLEGTKDGVVVARYRPDGREVAMGGGDSVVRIFDARSAAVVRRLTGHTANIAALSYSENGALLASGSDDGSTRVWNADTGALLLAIPGAIEVNGVALDPTGKRVAVLTRNGVLHVYAVPAGTPLGQVKAHASVGTSVAWSSDGERIVSASVDRTAAVWDARTLRELARVRRHSGTVFTALFLPGTDRLLTAGDDDAIWLTEMPLETRSPDTIAKILHTER